MDDPYLSYANMNGALTIITQKKTYTKYGYTISY